MAKEKFVTEIWDDLVDQFSNIRSGSNMPRYLLPNMPCLFGRDLQVCDYCCVKLTLFKRKYICSHCRKVFCKQCVGHNTDKIVQCRICVVLLMRPPDKKLLLQLRVKDLQRFLTAHQVSTHGCVEKEDLVNLLLHYSDEKPGFSESSSAFSPNASSSAIPDEVGVEATPDSAELTNSAACASTSFSSPTVDTATTGMDLAASHIAVEEPIYSEISTEETFEEPEEKDDPAIIAVIAGTSSAILVTEAGVPLPSAGPSCSTEPIQRSSSSQLLEPSTSSNGDAVFHSFNASPPGSPHFSQSELAAGSPIFVRPSVSTIRSKQDMEQMSVKQLKCLLARHRVDYHGCCEKAELVERATRLWVDYRASRADLDNLELEELCKVCMDAPIECVMLECGHMATCTDCGRQLCECPICRQYVVRIVRTFRA